MGDGAYKISGGMNGGYVGFLYGGALAMSVYSMTETKASFAAGAAAFALIVASILVIYNAYLLLYGEDVSQCFLTGVVAGVALVGVALGGSRFTGGLLAMLAVAIGWNGTAPNKCLI